MFGFGEHHGSDHGSSHASNDACTHATDHYHDSVHAFSRDAGHAVDSAFGNGHHHVTAGQVVQDSINVYGARQEMNQTCGSE